MMQATWICQRQVFFKQKSKSTVIYFEKHNSDYSNFTITGALAIIVSLYLIYKLNIITGMNGQEKSYPVSGIPLISESIFIKQSSWEVTLFVLGTSRTDQTRMSSACYLPHNQLSNSL
jgi:hypothetical protein